jgi:hypothetical protein
MQLYLQLTATPVGNGLNNTSTFTALRNPLYRKLWFAVLLVSINTGRGSGDFPVSSSQPFAHLLPARLPLPTS